MARVHRSEADAAVAMAAKASGLNLTLKNHGLMGRGQGWSVGIGEGSRLSPIGTISEVYYYANLIADTAWAMRRESTKVREVA